MAAAPQSVRIAAHLSLSGRNFDSGEAGIPAPPNVSSAAGQVSSDAAEAVGYHVSWRPPGHVALFLQNTDLNDLSLIYESDILQTLTTSFKVEGKMYAMSISRLYCIEMTGNWEMLYTVFFS